VRTPRCPRQLKQQRLADLISVEFRTMTLDLACHNPAGLPEIVAVAP